MNTNILSELLSVNGLNCWKAPGRGAFPVCLDAACPKARGLFMSVSFVLTRGCNFIPFMLVIKHIVI